MRTVSEYVLGPAGWLVSLAMIAFAIGVFALVAAIGGVLTGPRPWTGLIALALVGVAASVAAAAPADVVDPVNPTIGSQHAAVHALAGLVWFGGLSVAAPSLSRRLAPAVSRRSRMSLWASAWIVPATVVLFVLSTVFDRTFGAPFDRVSAQGITERLAVVAFVTWIVTAALATRRRPPDKIAGCEYSGTA